MVFELRLYRSLFRWLTRRPDLGDGEDTPVTYARTATPVMWLWIFASAVELPLVHILVPWEAVRIALLAAGVWGLVWMVGLLASLYVYPAPPGSRAAAGQVRRLPLHRGAVGVGGLGDPLLREPVTLSTAKGPMSIVELSFFADDLRATVRHARGPLGRSDVGR